MVTAEVMKMISTFPTVFSGSRRGRGRAGGSLGKVATPASVTVPVKISKRSGNTMDLVPTQTWVQIPICAQTSCVTLGSSLPSLSAFLSSTGEIMSFFQGWGEPQMK